MPDDIFDFRTRTPSDRHSKPDLNARRMVSAAARLYDCTGAMKRAETAERAQHHLGVVLHLMSAYTAVCEAYELLTLCSGLPEGMLARMQERKEHVKHLAQAAQERIGRC